MFKNAIIRAPGDNFADGLTTAGLGKPVFEKALEQYERYCEALQECSLTLTRLEADPNYPDATFVEDTAIITEQCAILTHPGAISRAGEVAGIMDTIAGFYSHLETITPPGTLEGGDVCRVNDHFFVGISERTNEEGARQLAEILSEEGYSSTYVDIRGIPGILHLKSGAAYLGNNRMVLIESLVGREEFHGYDIVRVEPSENRAANCILVNNKVLIAAGFPAFEATLRRLDYPVLVLEMSEFQKMDGGLSCLSLRF
jgi:dimethylargininase